jgi:hypothetical protein
MTVLLSVIKDLWDFSLSSLGFSKKPALSENLLAKTLLLEAAHARTPAPAALDSGHLDYKTKSEAVIHELAFGSKAFVCVDGAKIFHRPVWTFDGAFMSLAYATDVQVLSFEGSFVHIRYQDQYGFIVKEDIEEVAEKIFPNFNKGEIYSANHPDTKKIRQYIKDEFFAETLFLPMQSVEFAYYKLLIEKRRINWPNERPRLAGNWKDMLKGLSGVQIGIVPKTSSIIEYVKPDGSGWVGYVKSVMIDNSIVVMGVGRIIEGEYSEDILSKEEWLSLQPVFISVS